MGGEGRDRIRRKSDRGGDRERDGEACRREWFGPLQLGSVVVVAVAAVKVDGAAECQSWGHLWTDQLLQPRPFRSTHVRR